MEVNKNERIIKINTCNVCGRSLKEEWDFCPFCKTKVDNDKCVYCSKEVKATWKFCPYCMKEIKVDNKDKNRLAECNNWLRSILGK